MNLYFYICSSITRSFLFVLNKINSVNKKQQNHLISKISIIYFKVIMLSTIIQKYFKISIQNFTKL